MFTNGFWLLPFCPNQLTANTPISTIYCPFSFHLPDLNSFFQNLNFFALTIKLLTFIQPHLYTIYICLCLHSFNDSSSRITNQKKRRWNIQMQNSGLILIDKIHFSFNIKFHSFCYFIGNANGQFNDIQIQNDERFIKW